MFESFPVLERFKSATILADVDPLYRVVPSSSILARWISSLHTWFLTHCIADSGRHDLLYGRDISLVGKDLLRSNEILEIAEIARSLGFGFGLSASADHLIDYSDYLLKMISSKLITSLSVGLREDLSIDDQRLPGLIRELARNGVNVALMAPAKVITKTRAITSAISGSDVVIHPIESLPVPPDRPPSTSPCYAKFRLFVDQLGDIYPCLGLVGIERCSLGNIYDDEFPPGLINSAVLRELDEWNRKGPLFRVLRPPDSDECGALPPICGAHRDSFFR